MLPLLRRQLISSRLSYVSRLSNAQPLLKSFHNGAIRLQDEKATKAETATEADKKPLASPIFTSGSFEDPDVTETTTEKKEEKPTGQKGKKKHFKTNAEIRGTTLRNRLLLVLFAMGAWGTYHFGQEFSEEELELKDVPKDGSLPDRIRFRLNRNITYLAEPAFPVLLPDQPPAPPGEKQRLTLVMNLDETLIKTMWDREHGYRCAKRPGLDRFLGLTSCLFETVVFTSQQMFNAEIIIKNIDPYSMFFLHHLFREHTRFHDGKI
ncbi:HAD-like protein, partial [Conidiobolus coronatus NRRL 28638]